MNRLPPLDLYNYPVPGSDAVNYGAAWNHQIRIQEDRKRYASVQKPKVDEYRAHMDRISETVIKPRAEAALAAGTSRSTAHVFFEGRHYTLPSKRTSMTDMALKFSDQYGGLHGTDEMHEAIRKSMQNLVFHNMEIARSNKKIEEKSTRKFFKSFKQPADKFELVSEDLIWEHFARKFAESRVAIGTALVMAPDGIQDRVLTHPSSETGDYLGEMRAWSEAHWRGVPEKKIRSWNNEVMTHFPRRKI